MSLGIRIGVGIGRRFGLFGIGGSAISLVTPVENDTLDDVTTYGVMTSGTLFAREQQINGGAWAAYLGTTVLTALQTVRVREEWRRGTRVRIDTTQIETVVGVPSATYPVVRSRSTGAVGTATSGAHAVANPAGATIGDLVMFVIGFSTYPSTTVTITGGTGWTLNSGFFGLVVVWKVLDGTGDSLSVTPSAARQSSHRGWCFSDFTGSPIIGTLNQQVGNVAPDGPSLAFGGTKPCRVISAGVQLQSNTIQSGGPSGYSDFTTINSNTNGSSSCRTFAAELEVTGTSEDPGAYPVSVTTPYTITIAVEG